MGPLHENSPKMTKNFRKKNRNKIKNKKKNVDAHRVHCNAIVELAIRIGQLIIETKNFNVKTVRFGYDTIGDAHNRNF